MHINVKHLLALKISVFETFIAVVDKGSFSDAADLRALSASSVTVQIKQLENIVGYKLLIRGKDQAVLTEAGIQVLKLARTIVEGVTTLEKGLNESAESMTGTVKYAMPESCLLSPHFGMLLEKRKQYPGINLVVNLMLTEEVLKLIKENKSDFGFVTEKFANPNLTYEPFCKEEYILVASDENKINELNESNILDFDFVGHPSFDQLFMHLKNHYFPKLIDVNSMSLISPNRFNSLEGGIQMVLGGLGCSVFPRHTIQKLLDEKKLFEYKSEISPLLKDIYIIQHKGADMNPRVRQVIDWFLELHDDGCGNDVILRANIS